MQPEVVVHRSIRCAGFYAAQDWIL